MRTTKWSINCLTFAKVFVIPSEDSTTFTYIRKSYLAFIDDFELIILEEAEFRTASQVKANNINEANYD